MFGTPKKPESEVIVYTASAPPAPIKEKVVTDYSYIGGVTPKSLFSDNKYSINTSQSRHLRDSGPLISGRGID